MTHRLPIACIALSGLLLLPATRPVHAAQSYDGCAGFIDALPATISTQGVWCLRHDLATNIGGGAAITIAANNVTIDCNDFKIGGLAAGNGSQATGIYTYNQQNATVRHCNVRGFLKGIALELGAGHLVEDNRLDNNYMIGIGVDAENSVVQRNRVFDTGGNPLGSEDHHYPSYGIWSWAVMGISASGADVLDNLVDGMTSPPSVQPNKANTYSVTMLGIWSSGTGSVVRGNRIRGQRMDSSGGFIEGIYVSYPGANVGNDDGQFVESNALSLPQNSNAGGSIGLAANNAASCSGNHFIGYASAIVSGGCTQ